MYDFLLFVHVLSAFCLMAVVVMYTAWACTRRPRRDWCCSPRSSWGSAAPGR